MKTSEKAKAILNLVDECLKNAIEEKVKAFAKWESDKAGYRAWKEEMDKSDDWVGGGPGFGRCPYNSDHSQKRYEDAQKELDACLEVKKFAVDTFLEMIDE